MKPAYINIRKLSISFVPDHLFEVIPNLKFPTELVVRVYSDGLEEYGGNIKFLFNDMLCPIQIPEIQPILCPINDIRYIQAQKIFFAIYQITGSKLGPCIGQAIILLQKATFTQFENVSGSLERFSHCLGEISFQTRLSL